MITINKNKAVEDTAEKLWKAGIECELVCGDGTGGKNKKHVSTCPKLALDEKLNSPEKLK